MSDGNRERETSLDDPRWREAADSDADADAAGDDGGREYPTADTRDRTPSDEEADPVELGVALLSRLEHAELSVAEALDRVEAITRSPDRQREILETAEARGLIEREGGTLRPTPGAGRGHLSFEREVVVRHGEYTCKRCGADVGEGHFVRLDPGEVGPYGSSCIRKVVGRE